MFPTALAVIWRILHLPAPEGLGADVPNPSQLTACCMAHHSALGFGQAPWRCSAEFLTKSSVGEMILGPPEPGLGILTWPVSSLDWSWFRTWIWRVKKPPVQPSLYFSSRDVARGWVTFGLVVLYSEYKMCGIGYSLQQPCGQLATAWNVLKHCKNSKSLQIF